MAGITAQGTTSGDAGLPKLLQVFALHLRLTFPQHFSNHRDDQDFS